MSNPKIEASLAASDIERRVGQMKHLAFSVRDHHLQEIEAFAALAPGRVGELLQPMLDAAESLLTLIADIAANAEDDAAALSEQIEQLLPSSLPLTKSDETRVSPEGPFLRSVSNV